MSKKRRLHSIWLEPPRNIVKLYVPKQKTVWVEPFHDHPCIFVCNHERAFGPLAMMSRFELHKELIPWVIGEVCHARELPEYARRDFWCKPNKWYTWLYNHTVVYFGALIVPPIMRWCRSIEVYHDARVKKTFSDSVEVLEKGGKIVLFPEKPQAFGDYGNELMSGFVFTAKLYEKKTGKKLDMYPVYLNKAQKKIVVGKPLQLSGTLKTKDESKVLASQIAEKMHELSKY